jgi:chromosome segregation ATPase
MANVTTAATVNVEFSSIGQMRKAIKEATSDLIAMQEQFGKTSPQAIEAANRIADLKDRIEDAKEQADLFDPGKKFQAFTTAASQVAAGFSAVQGALALVGAESDDVQKALLKVQGALALSQGLSQLGDLEKSFTALSTAISSSTIIQKANAAATTLTSGAMRALGISVNTTSTSFKVLRTAIIATGIGALVVAIGFAVEALMNLADSTDEATKAEKELEKQNKRTEEAIKLKNQALQESIEATDAAAIIAVKRAKLEGKSEDDILKIQREALQKKIDLRKKDLESLDTSSEEFFQKKTEYGKAISDLENFELDAQIKRLEDGQRKQDEINKKAEEKREKDKKDREERAKEIQEERAKEQEDINKLIEKELETQKAIEDARLKELEDERKAADQREEQRLRERIQAQKEFAAASLEAEIELQNAKFNAVSAGLNAIATLAGQNEKLANIMFAIDKAMAIAKIIVDAKREIGGYYATYSIFGPKGFALASKFALGAKIRAATSIATIAATTIAKFRGGGGGASAGGGGGADVAGGGGAPVSAEPTPTVTAQALNAQAINQLGNQSMRAYILNSDMQNNEQRNAYLERNARLG